MTTSDSSADALRTQDSALSTSWAKDSLAFSENLYGVGGIALSPPCPRPRCADRAQRRAPPRLRLVGIWRVSARELTSRPPGVWSSTGVQVEIVDGRSGRTRLDDRWSEWK